MLPSVLQPFRLSFFLRLVHLLSHLYDLPFLWDSTVFFLAPMHYVGPSFLSPFSLCVIHQDAPSFAWAASPHLHSFPEALLTRLRHAFFLPFFSTLLLFLHSGSFSPCALDCSTSYSRIPLSSFALPAFESFFPSPYSSPHSFHFQFIDTFHSPPSFLSYHLSYPFLRRISLPIIYPCFHLCTSARALLPQPTFAMYCFFCILFLYGHLFFVLPFNAFFSSFSSAGPAVFPTACTSPCVCMGYFALFASMSSSISVFPFDWCPFARSFSTLEPRTLDVGYMDCFSHVLPFRVFSRSLSCPISLVMPTCVHHFVFLCRFSHLFHLSFPISRPLLPSLTSFLPHHSLTNPHSNRTNQNTALLIHPHLLHSSTSFFYHHQQNSRPTIQKAAPKRRQTRTRKSRKGTSGV